MNHKAPKDPLVLALTGAVTSILSGLGLLEKWGMSADDVGLIGGGLATLLGTLAVIFHGRKAAKLEAADEKTEETDGSEA